MGLSASQQIYGTFFGKIMSSYLAPNVNHSVYMEFDMAASRLTTGFCILASDKGHAGSLLGQKHVI